MRLDARRVRELARTRGMTLGEALRRAGVSRTAYYSLTRRPTALPGTIHALAGTLGLPPSALLVEDPPPARRRTEALLREARKIHAQKRDGSFENIWHTLFLLDAAPAERLNRSLIRGRAAPVRR